jgi:rhodanese-related sulfurtransferase
MQTRSILLIVALLIIPGCGNIVPSLDTPPPAGATALVVNEIEPAKALPRVQEAYSQFVDVRTPEEYKGGHAVRAINIPLNELPAKLDRLEKNEPVYVICQSGRRSKEAAEILNRNGFKWVFDVTGGTNEWSAQGLPMESTAR